MLSALFVIATSVLGQLERKDQYEFGYKGKVKQVVKKTYECETKDCELEEFKYEAPVTNFYYYNKEGNLDSTIAKRYFKGSAIVLRTKYQFDNSRKSGWETLTVFNQPFVSAVTNWISDREYMEKIYGADKRLQIEARYWLNDSFRLVKFQTRRFDEMAKVIEEQVQKYEFDDAGNIKTYTNTNRDGLTDIARYNYLKSDEMGNPVKLVVKKDGDRVKRVVFMTFTYYED
jgi:hypothetical protein